MLAVSISADAAKGFCRKGLLCVNGEIDYEVYSPVFLQIYRLMNRELTLSQTKPLLTQDTRVIQSSALILLQYFRTSTVTMVLKQRMLICNKVCGGMNNCPLFEILHTYTSIIFFLILDMCVLKLNDLYGFTVLVIIIGYCVQPRYRSKWMKPRVQYLPVFVYSPENFLISDLWNRGMNFLRGCEVSQATNSFDWCWSKSRSWSKNFKQNFTTPILRLFCDISGHGGYLQSPSALLRIVTEDVLFAQALILTREVCQDKGRPVYHCAVLYSVVIVHRINHWATADSLFVKLYLPSNGRHKRRNLTKLN